MSPHISNLKLSFGGVLGVSQGVEGVTSDMTVQPELTFCYPYYLEIRGISHLFLKNPKWLPNTSHNIYSMMHLGVDLLADLVVDLLIGIPEH